MVYTKLERSFDAEELHKFLKGSLKTEEADEKDPNAVINKIERPPLPRGSTIFEMVSLVYIEFWKSQCQIQAV